ncbi:MAG: GNAT family N-acetyltransferase [Deltaproteobacteria bacterium]|nr:GNAT family N-acetyltransferase [Deltaproteobacteria bacterium]
MADYLVRLYDLPDPGDHLRALCAAGVTVRRPMAYEKRALLGWIGERFGAGWASECEAAFGGHPFSCFIATREGTILGFACYDCTCRGFFGPTGVEGEARGRGVGKGLLLACLRAMREVGYGYAVIGGAASGEFYERSVGAFEIPGSSPGVYVDRLRPES